MKSTQFPVIPESYIGAECPEEPRAYTGRPTNFVQIKGPIEHFDGEEVVKAYVKFGVALSRKSTPDKVIVAQANRLLRTSQRSELPSDEPVIYETIRVTAERSLRQIAQNRYQLIKEKSNIDLTPTEATMIFRYFLGCAQETKKTVSLVLFGLGSVKSVYGATAIMRARDMLSETVRGAFDGSTGLSVIARHQKGEGEGDLFIASYDLAPANIEERTRKAIDALVDENLFSTIEGEKSYKNLRATILSLDKSASESVEKVVRAFDRGLTIAKNESSRQRITTRTIAA